LKKKVEKKFPCSMMKIHGFVMNPIG